MLIVQILPAPNCYLPIKSDITCMYVGYTHFGEKSLGIS